MNSLATTSFQERLVSQYGLELVKMGSEYGCWQFADILTSESVVLTFGAGEDVTFDFSLIRHTGCKVHCFDPTPNAIRHVGDVRRLMLEGRLQLSRYKNFSAKDAVNLIFHSIGIWKETTELEFFSPPKKGMASFSVMNLHGGDSSVFLKCKSFSDICADLEVEKVDLVKLDVEGAEYAAIESILASGVLPQQLLVEFDEGWKPKDDGALSRITTTCNLLRDAGYDLVHLDGWDFTFFKR